MRDTNSYSRGWEDCIQYLIDSGVDINCRDEDCRTPLLNSFKFKYLPEAKIIKCLIDNGADINLVDADGDYLGKHRHRVKAYAKEVNTNAKVYPKKQVIEANNLLNIFNECNFLPQNELNIRSSIGRKISGNTEGTKYLHCSACNKKLPANFVTGNACVHCGAIISTEIKSGSYLP